MNISNIAIVRATNIIPFDGIVKPISNVQYLTKNIGLDFSASMSDLLKNIGIIPPIDPTKIFEENYYDNMVSLSSKILKEYLPYVSDYNSFVLFSLNGLCPDDSDHGFGNNTFSDKNCVVIDSLLHHIDNVVSLVPTDTAFKGNVYLSKDAIILIRLDIFNSLSDYERKLLSMLPLTVKTFEGNLKEVVYSELLNSKKYIPETLSLSSSTGGFETSNTSEMQKECIKEIALEYGLAQQKYFNLITTSDKSMPRYEDVKNEYNYAVTVQDYFMRMFLEELLVVLNAPNDMKKMLQTGVALHNREYMNKLMVLIRDYGIDSYKLFIDRYNRKLEEQRNNFSLITPQEVISNLTEVNNLKK